MLNFTSILNLVLKLAETCFANDHCCVTHPAPLLRELCENGFDLISTGTLVFAHPFDGTLVHRTHTTHCAVTNPPAGRSTTVSTRVLAAGKANPHMSMRNSGLVTRVLCYYVTQLLSRDLSRRADIATPLCSGGPVLETAYSDKFLSFPQSLQQNSKRLR
jgi:hypothetical protein